MFFSLAVCFILPTVAWILLARKQKGIYVAVFAGVLGFLVPQTLIRLPIVQMLSRQEWFVNFAQNSFVLYALILAFSAGLFETAGRMLVAQFLLKRRRDFRSAFAAGLGHGAFEAVTLTGMVYVNNLIIAALLSFGVLESLAPFIGLDPALVPELAETFSTLSPSLFFLAGFERICAMTLHISMMVLLVYCMNHRRSYLGFVLATGFHTLLDGVFILLNQYVGAWVAYGFLALFAAGCVWLIWKLRPGFEGGERLIAETVD